MIQPINHILEQCERAYVLNGERDISDCFPKESHPLFFGTNNRTYLVFLHDSDMPTVYEAKMFGAYEKAKEPLTLRLLTNNGAKRIRKKVDPTLQSYVERANDRMQPHVDAFWNYLRENDVIRAEGELEKASKSIKEGVVWICWGTTLGLPEGLYDRLKTQPETLAEQLTPERYMMAVDVYLQKARENASRGYGARAITLMCSYAKRCTEKVENPFWKAEKVKLIERARTEYIRLADQMNQIHKREMLNAPGIVGSDESYRVAEENWGYK